jgi:hypothetical protein
MASVVLKKLSPVFDKLYADIGHASIPPKQLLKIHVLITRNNKGGSYELTPFLFLKPN